MPRNVNLHGAPPYGVAVLHGGPGGAGEIAPVAAELAARGYGVLEPLQTGRSIAAQIDELALCLETHGEPPLVVIGWSWGAWLACLLAARHPSLASKLVLVGTPPFDAADARHIQETRRARLTAEEASELEAIFAEASDAPGDIARMVRLFDRSDAFAPIDYADAPIAFNREIFASVWPEASELRRTGELLRRCGRIACPVHAIHGDHDPHPARGVEIPLNAAISDFQFTLLEKCGHKPWLERHARDAFYRVLETAIDAPRGGRPPP